MASLDEAANKIVDQATATMLFTKLIVFKDNDECTVLRANVEAKHEDLIKIRNAFGDYDLAIGAGFDLEDRHYDISRWFPDRGLIYGRFGGPDFEGGEGIAAYRAKSIITVLCFGFPYVSSRCIPVGQKIIDAVLAE